MRSLSDDMESLCLVKECRELELYYGTNLTDIVLTDPDTISRRASRKNLRVIDRDKLVEKCSMKSPSIACIIRKGGSWPKLWDSALQLGSIGTPLVCRICQDYWYIMVVVYNHVPYVMNKAYQYLSLIM